MRFHFLRHAFVLLSGLLAGATVFSQGQPFYPNDPYFAPDATGLASGYSGQWHLHNQMPLQEGINAGIDINILGAWQMGYTGKGVIIGIIDDGVDSQHEDLSASFHNAYSWDFGFSREENLASANRGSPRLTNDPHGTSVAGLAAAIGGNGIGVSGAAPGAGTASLAILYRTEDSDVFDRDDSRAVLFQGQSGTDGLPDPTAAPDWNAGIPVRVKNHSYGVMASYFDISAVVSEAFNESLAHDVIHVMAAGNNRTPISATEWPNNIDSSKAQTMNTPGIIVVAALAANGKFASYSNYGANIFVTAPGANENPEQFMMTTTDRRGSAGYNRDVLAKTDPYFDPEHPEAGTDVLDYASSFLGTSAAAPVVSGVMALGVEANPDLNARTAQHILVRTSRIVDTDDSTREGGWVVNAAGRAFNRNYGFGLIDATAFVRMAAQRGHATEQTTYHSGPIDVEKSFSQNVSSLFVHHYADIPFDSLQPVEYISIQILLTGLQTSFEAYGTGTGDGIGSIQGDFEAWLTSPDGTRQMLFADDRAMIASHAAQRASDSDTLDWEFLSYAYWGENPIGEWILELVNNTGNIPTGMWEKVAFTIGMGDYVIPELKTSVLILAFVCVTITAARRRRKSTVC